MPVPRPLRPRSPADAHHDGRKTARRQRTRHISGLSYDPATPSSISGLIAWHDFSDIAYLYQDVAKTSPITADGQTILAAADKSGTGNDLTVAVNGPTYEVGIQNSLSVARFDGSNDILSKTGMSAPSAWTWLGVFVKRGAITTGTDTAVALHSGGNGQLFTDSDNSATGLNWFANDGGGVSTDVATDPLSWGTKVIRANTTASMDFYTGGGTAVNINPIDTVFLSATDIALGANLDTGNNADVDIGESLLYNVALSAGNLNTLGNYLAAKWGVTWTTVS